MAIYPAYVHVDADGSASGFFPDVNGCFFSAEAGESIHEEALSVLEAHFELLVLDDKDIPEPHEMPYHVVNDVTAYSDDDGQWYNVNIDMTKFSGKVERVNITLPHRLLHQIDDYIKTSNYPSRSAFIAELSKKELAMNKANK